MPLMTQIRNNLTKLFAGFAVLFIAYIMLDWGMDLPSLRPGGAGDTVGEVNGQKISYREFSELQRRAFEAQRSQTGQEPDDETERQIRSQIWNTLVTQILINQEIERLGVRVTDKEIIDLVHGPNPPDQLINMFRDSTGVFNRAAYDRAIADPQNREAWLQVEQQLREQLRQQKLQSMTFATIRVNEGEIKQRFVDRNVVMEADYVLFDPNRMVPDSMVVVADDEIEKRYQASQDEFKVRPSRRLKYIIFSSSPSGQDTADILNEMQRLREQARAGIDFMELAKTYSEIPVTEAFYKHGELTPEKENAVFSARKGDIVGPVLDFDGYHLIKVLDERQGKEDFVRASHILFTPTSADTTSTLQLARDVLRQIRSGASFEEMARKYGSDGTAPQGGDLGWGGRGTWVKPFADAAFRSSVNEVVGPIRTQFGWHLIKVTGKNRRELKLVDVLLRIKASPQSIDAAYRRAEDFAYLAGEEGFEKAAENSSHQIRETPEFTKGGAIPGFGINDAVMSFAFSHKVDKVSDPVSISGGLAVFKVSAVRVEGVRPLADVKNIVRSMVLRKKKMERVNDEVRTFSKGISASSDLLAASRSIPNVIAQSTGPFRGQEAPNAVGRDLVFLGVAQSLQQGELSKPFEGSRGYYIMKLTSKTPFDSTLYATERSSLRGQILQEKQNQFSSEWLASLREQAEITDYRNRFFR